MRRCDVQIEDTPRTHSQALNVRTSLYQVQQQRVLGLSAITAAQGGTRAGHVSDDPIKLMSPHVFFMPSFAGNNNN